MQIRISPLRHAAESILDLVGLGPRRSLFTAARNPESRVRFAQYMNRVQPDTEHNHSNHRTIRFLVDDDAVSRGIIRHAPSEPDVLPVRQPAFRVSSQMGGFAAMRRSREHDTPNPFKLLLHALRVR